LVKKVIFGANPQFSGWGISGERGRDAQTTVTLSTRAPRTLGGGVLVKKGTRCQKDYFFSIDGQWISRAKAMNASPSRQYAFQFAEMLSCEFDGFLQDLMETHHFNVCSACLDLEQQNMTRK